MSLQRFYTQRRAVVGIQLDGTNWDTAVEFIENQCTSSQCMLNVSRMHEDEPVSIGVMDKDVYESRPEVVGVGDWIVLNTKTRKADLYTEAEWHESFDYIRPANNFITSLDGGEQLAPEFGSMLVPMERISDGAVFTKPDGSEYTLTKTKEPDEN